MANARSWASVAIAHHYAELRKIPAVNVLYLDWPYSTDIIDINTFRDKLLLPVFTSMQSRGVISQIDYVVYSSDFPVAIDFQSDLGDAKAHPAATPTGSLTAMTYHTPQLMTRNYGGIVAGNGNRYMRQLSSNELPAESQAFRSWYGFGPDGKLREGGGDLYVISAMLGVTSNYGLSVDETLAYLRRSVEADGTKPQGTVYFCRTGDEARSAPREPQFAAAISSLKKIGHDAQIVSGQLPMKKNDVAGLLTGLKTFDWKATQSTLLPGALCENLTSYGGVFTPHDQTRLTEFLRYGAAGATGTVIEPYNIPQKFSTAYAQVHYARGCNLAESLYQAVACPFQLLLVGDPLCAPWATPPTISVEGVTPNETIKGTVSLRPTSEGAAPVDRFELYVDGLFVNSCQAGGAIELDTTKLPDGYCELRVVGAESTAIETQGRAFIPVSIDNHGRKVELTCSAQDTASWYQPLKLKAVAPGAKRIDFSERTALIGRSEESEPEIEIDPKFLSLGPVEIVARAFYGDGTEVATSAPLKLSIVPDAALPGRPLRKGIKLAHGLQFKGEGDSTILPVPLTDSGDWLARTKVGARQKFVLASIFDVPSDGVYQFEVRHTGPLSVKVDNRPIYNVEDREQAEWSYIPVSLAQGHHQFELRGIGGQPGGMIIRFGRSGVIDLDGKQFQSLPMRRE